MDGGDTARGAPRIDLLQADEIDDDRIGAAQERLFRAAPARIKPWSAEDLITLQRQQREHVTLGEFRNGADFHGRLGRIEGIVEEAFGISHIAQRGRGHGAVDPQGLAVAEDGQVDPEVDFVDEGLREHAHPGITPWHILGARAGHDLILIAELTLGGPSGRQVLPG